MSTTDTRLLPDEPVTSLADHIDRGGGVGLATALEMEPEEVIDLLEGSGLRGRGGAGFPTVMKWRSILGGAGETSEGAPPVAIVVNGAEGEPGTYKDRAIMLANPWQFLEGVLIAAHAVGATRIFIGTKDRFDDVRARLTDAIEQAIAADWPGAQAIQIVAGPDEYLFGEETALLEVVEGKLPMPRHLPPYVNGLFTESTNPSVALVNNVETLTNIPLIIGDGAESWAAVGTDDSPGTMVFTVVGDVTTPGVYELPLGTPLRTLLFDIAGADDVMAVFSGVANAVITPDMLDTPLSFDLMRDAGSGLGSGGFIVYDHSHCIVRVAAILNHFLAIESCGQCNACKLGTDAIATTLKRIDLGEGTDTDLETLVHWAAQVTDLARCGLPMGAQLMVASLLDRFSDEFHAHLGRPCESDVIEHVPKISGLEPESGGVTFDQDYDRKRTDWSYADSPEEHWQR